MGKEVIMEAKGLGYRIGRQYLLQDISWEIRRGEHWVLFGLNGSGKTTLLGILAGYNEQTEGLLRVFGSAYTDGSLLAKRQRIALVSSSFFDAYYHNERVLEIILSGACGTLGLDFDIDDGAIKAAKALAASMNLQDKLDQSYGSLSKGERENVLIARALTANPEILILDEPCSGLDVIARDKMLALVEALAQNGAATIIYVTHYAEEVLPCFEKGVLLRQGKIYQQGERAALFTEETMCAFLQTAVRVDTDPLGRTTIAVLQQSPLAWRQGGEAQ